MSGAPDDREGLPGAGWPDDPAMPETPVATDAEDVVSLAAAAPDLAALDACVSVCRACPRLVAWREEVARTRRRSYAGETYWARPVPGWGDEHPRVLVAGLAPAAHGGNRTGRIFTGDRSGDWLFAALHRAGLATQPTSVHAGDGQRLVDARLVAAVRCAPPQNKPSVVERDTCAPWFVAELRKVSGDVRVAVALGSFAWQSLWTGLRQAGWDVPRPRPPFGHGVEAWVRRPDGVPALVLGCYHPSQQNTFTGKLTESMLDAVFARAARECRSR